MGEKHSVADDAIRQAEEASARVQALEEAQKSLAEQARSFNPVFVTQFVRFTLAVTYNVTVFS